MTKEELKRAVFFWLEKYCGVSTDQFQEQTSLFTSGILTSLDAIRLLQYLDNRFPQEKFYHKISSVHALNSVRELSTACYLE